MGYLDGARETISHDGGSALSVDVYNEGIVGEFTDYFSERCLGVEVNIGIDGTLPTGAASTWWTSTNGDGSLAGIYTYELTSGYYLDDLTSAEQSLLKKCLGDSDGDLSSTSNVEVYDWDYGSLLVNAGGSSNYASMTTPKLDTMSSHPHAIKLVQKTLLRRWTTSMLATTTSPGTSRS